MDLEQAPQTAIDGVVGQVQFPVGHDATDGVTFLLKMPL